MERRDKRQWTKITGKIDFQEDIVSEADECERSDGELVLLRLEEMEEVMEEGRKKRASVEERGRGRKRCREMKKERDIMAMRRRGTEL